uniref:fibroin heavy chain-like isoform X2 n=1 Tax=Styela clava TaxID=7725 RepID=UPI00193A095A|nr:fibroin heavy chain-like isoform X2 [Styela clava]
MGPKTAVRSYKGSSKSGGTANRKIAFVAFALDGIILLVAVYLFATIPSCGERGNQDDNFGYGDAVADYNYSEAGKIDIQFNGNDSIIFNQFEPSSYDSSYASNYDMSSYGYYGSDIDSYYGYGSSNAYDSTYGSNYGNGDMSGYGSTYGTGPVIANILNSSYASSYGPGYTTGSMYGTDSTYGQTYGSGYDPTYAYGYGYPYESSYAGSASQYGYYPTNGYDYSNSGGYGTGSPYDYNNAYGYDSSHSGSYGTSSTYDSTYGSWYGTDYGTGYGSTYGSMYGSGYGSSYSGSYGAGSTYDSSYGSSYGTGYDSNYGTGSTYGSSYVPSYGTGYDSTYGTGSTYGSSYVPSYGTGYDSTYGTGSTYGSSYVPSYGTGYDSTYGTGSTYGSSYGPSYGTGYDSTYGTGSTYDSSYGYGYDPTNGYNYGTGSTYDSNYGTGYDSTFGHDTTFDSSHGSSPVAGHGSSYDSSGASGYGSIPDIGSSYEVAQSPGETGEASAISGINVGTESHVGGSADGEFSPDGGTTEQGSSSASGDLVQLMPEDKFSNTNFKCGVPKIKPNLGKGRVVGGSEAVKHSWPWIAHVMNKFPRVYGYLKHCGSTIVSPRHVISAYHCFTEERNWKDEMFVFVGKHDESIPGTKYAIANVRIHPKGEVDPDLYYDLVIVTTKEEVKFSDIVQPACLPKPRVVKSSGTWCWAYGWGFVEGTGAEDQLKQVKLQIGSEEECRTAWGYPPQVNLLDKEAVVCAGNEKGQDTCQGDSGGPLTCDEDGKAFLYGVVSYGQTCGSGIYGVYAAVSFSMEWICCYMPDIPSCEGVNCNPNG